MAESLWQFYCLVKKKREKEKEKIKKKGEGEKKKKKTGSQIVFLLRIQSRDSGMVNLWTLWSIKLLHLIN